MNDLLALSLQAAVPIWIERIRTWPEEERNKRRAACAQTVAEHGDRILYKSKVPGQTAEAFNHLAEGIALLAFAPGGVTAFGLHFEAPT